MKKSSHHVHVFTTSADAKKVLFILTTRLSFIGVILHSVSKFSFLSEKSTLDKILGNV